MSKPKASYNDILREELSGLVNELELPELYKQSMKSRWLDQVLWTEGKASKAQQRFYSLRLTTVIGGVIIPALVAFNNFGIDDSALNKRFSDVFPMALFGLTQLVAVCTAVEEFFQYGVQWRQYRATAENLKSEGWQYFQLSGSYRKAKSHLQAYPVFSTRVERVLRRDVQSYLSEVAKDQNRDDDDDLDEDVKQGSINSGFFADPPETTIVQPSMSISEPTMATEPSASMNEPAMDKPTGIMNQPSTVNEPNSPFTTSEDPPRRTRRPAAPPSNPNQPAPYEPPASL
jgi:hypothetical protein